MDTGKLYGYLTKLLEYGLLIQGSKGLGKSYLLFLIFCLSCWLKWPLMLIDGSGKGDLYDMCRNWALANGFGSRLDLFDLSDKDHLIQYNLCMLTGDPDEFARALRDAVEAMHGNFKTGETPQLHWHSYLALYVAVEQKLSLLDAVRVLQNDAFRLDMIEKVHSPFIKEQLQAYDDLSPREQREVSGSTTVRLKGLLSSPNMYAMFTADGCYNMHQSLQDKRIMLVKAAGGDDEIMLACTFVLNQLMFECRRLHQKGLLDKDHPALFIGDECQMYGSVMLAQQLDRYRGIGLHAILAHHDSFQLQYRDESGYLRHTADVNIGSHATFGGITDEMELRRGVFTYFLDQLDPNRTLDIETPHIIPKESTRIQKSVQVSEQEGETIQYPHSVTTSDGGGFDISDTESHTEALARSDVDSWADAESEDGSESEMTGSRKVAASFFGGGETLELPVSYATLAARQGKTHSDGGARVLTDIVSNSKSRSWRVGKNWQESETNGVTPGTSKVKGLTLGATVVPFYEQDVIWLKTQPMSLEWQVVLYSRLLRDTPKGYFWLKVPNEPAVLIQCFYLETPRYTRQVKERLERLWTDPLYFSRVATVKLRVEAPIALNGYQNGYVRDFFDETD